MHKTETNGDVLHVQYPICIHIPTVCIYVHTCTQVSSKSLLEASEVLKSGGVVALSTDTLYGIACSVGSSEGIQRLYDIKKRQGHKPVAICVSAIADFHR